MGLGALVRRAAGPLEPALANAYRGMFYDVGDFAAHLASLSDVARVLEVGAGEGAVIEALCARMPTARLIGIDPSARVGRLFRGDTSRVRFEQAQASELAAREPGSFDLVLAGDVLHHVADSALPDLWRALADLPRPGGWLVVKEWVTRPSLIYHLGWLSDRVITGERVHYRSREQWLDELTMHLLPRGFRLADEWLLRPWTTNHAFVLQRGPLLARAPGLAAGD